MLFWPRSLLTGPSAMPAFTSLTLIPVFEHSSSIIVSIVIPRRCIFSCLICLSSVSFSTSAIKFTPPSIRSSNCSFCPFPLAPTTPDQPPPRLTSPPPVSSESRPSDRGEYSGLKQEGMSLPHIVWICSGSETMSAPLMEAVIILGIPCQKFSHCIGYASFSTFDKKMQMIVHDHPGIHPNLARQQDLSQAVEVAVLCPPRHENSLLVYTPHHNMVQCSRHI